MAKRLLAAMLTLAALVGNAADDWQISFKFRTDRKMEPQSILAGVQGIDDGKWHDVVVMYHGHQTALMVDEFVEHEFDAAIQFAIPTNREVQGVKVEKTVNTAIVPVSELEKNSYNWTNRHERIMTEGKQMNPQVVVVGDSITQVWAGWDSIGGKDCSKEWKRDFPGVNALDMGFGFDRTQNILWRIDHGELDGIDPKVVILMAGINNFGTRKRKLHARGNTSWETAEAIIAIRERIAMKLPKAKVIVMGVFPRGWEKGSFYRYLPERANAILKNHFANDKTTTYVDAWPALLDDKGNMSKEVSYDSVHLTSEGLRRWRQCLSEWLR